MTTVPEIPTSRRDRQRANTLAEIKATAHQLMAEEGTAAISLRSIATRMGIVSSALYRYYPSRDDLVTALMIDAYRSQTDALKSALASSTEHSSVEVMLALCDAYRDWAFAQPIDFQLIYGSPLPQYTAPESEIMPVAVGVFEPIGQAIEAALRMGALVPRMTLPTVVLAQFSGMHTFSAYPFDPQTLVIGLTLWHQIHGFVILELFGHMGSLGDMSPFYRMQNLARLEQMGWQMTPFT